jgi:hypothetical protein
VRLLETSSGGVDGGGTSHLSPAALEQAYTIAGKSEAELGL